MNKYFVLGLILFFLTSIVFSASGTQGEINYFYNTSSFSSSFCSPNNSPPAHYSFEVDGNIVEIYFSFEGTRYLGLTEDSGICYTFDYNSQSKSFCDINYIIDSNETYFDANGTQYLSFNENIGACYENKYISQSNTFCNESILEINEGGVFSIDATKYLLFDNNTIGICYDFNYLKSNTCEGSTLCQDNDGCCPKSCTVNNDNDCSPCLGPCGCYLIEDCGFETQSSCASNDCYWDDWDGNQCTSNSWDPCSNLAYEYGYFSDPDVCYNHYYIIYEDEIKKAIQCAPYNELEYWASSEEECDSLGGEWIDGVCVGYNCMQGTVCSTHCFDRDNDGFDDCAEDDLNGNNTPIDCNDLDDSIYPGAPEICGDGIDQNCDGFDEPCVCVVNEDCVCGEICVDGLCVDVKCLAIYDPVCGLDGVTYSNACVAENFFNCPGVDCVGECPCPSEEELCLIGQEENEHYYPLCICPQVYSPVCGADGQTYMNACVAKCAEVDVVCLDSCPCSQEKIDELNNAVSAKSCLVDGDCELGQVCLDNCCVTECLVDEDCPPGEICVEDVCLPGCRTDEDCAPEEECIEGKCRLPCRDDDNQCPEYCTPINDNDCNDDCPSGTYWNGVECVDPCMDNDDICLPECDATNDNDCIDKDTVCPACTLVQEDTCLVIECVDDANCPGACTCSPNGICWFGDGINNSITHWDSNFPSIIFAEIQTKLENTVALVSLWDTNNNKIPISIILTGTNRTSDGFVFSTTTKTTYPIIPQISLEEGMYILKAEIAQPCTICKREVILYTKGFDLDEVTFSIPDNNILLILLVVGLLAFILPKKKNL